MRFGKSATEAADEPSRGGSGDWIKYLKKGDTTFRILQNPDDWTYYWEHFNPTGYSFPCPRGADDPKEMCPGCSSDNEKMSKLNRRIAFNVLEGWNGEDYVRVYKIGPMVADKLENRFARADTLTDRDYTITKYQTKQDRWDFDVEGHTPSHVDPSKYELKDVEAMLQDAWDQAWGEGSATKDPWRAQEPAEAAGSSKDPRALKPARRTTIAPTPAQEAPPFEEKTYQEAELRKMEYEDLVALVKNDMEVTPPDTVTTSDGVVDWLMEIQS